MMEREDAVAPTTSLSLWLFGRTRAHNESLGLHTDSSSALL